MRPPASEGTILDSAVSVSEKGQTSDLNGDP
jgi:hypothetical protein